MSMRKTNLVDFFLMTFMFSVVSCCPVFSPGGKTLKELLLKVAMLLKEGSIGLSQKAPVGMTIRRQFRPDTCRSLNSLHSYLQLWGPSFISDQK